ncbi:MAG: DUF1549 domain-containing protein [Planctomycetales bacterium]
MGLFSRSILLVGIIVGGLSVLAGAFTTRPLLLNPPPVNSDSDLAGVVQQVNQIFEKRWGVEQIVPAEQAADLKVLRRLSLALHGTIPSVEEIRLFIADEEPARLERWLDRMLADPRFSDYFGERLARVFVGKETGQFVMFRRDLFLVWVREQLQKQIPFDAMVREMISKEGLWTGEPATNFISAAVANQQIDENKLAGRTVRAFLGQRMDCAQCHDHPFSHWKQEQFEGLAAWYGQVRTSLAGVVDQKGEYVVEDRKTLQKRTVAPAVPFHPEWVPEKGTRRAKLAAWVTHPENRRFERAVANRIWALMFGRPYLDPVDDLPDPKPEGTDLLDILGKDFRTHHYDLRRLIRVVALSRPFGLDSVLPQHVSSDVDTHRLVEAWGMFPLVRLRPEQVIGSMLQASSIRTIDQNSNFLIRTLRFVREADFIKNYGDLGENEVTDRGGTIPQTLMKMNGKLTRELSDPNPFSAVGRINAFSGNHSQRVQIAYWACLSRDPTSTELMHFTGELSKVNEKQRPQVMSDLYWSLFNSPEFSWNH